MARRKLRDDPMVKLIRKHGFTKTQRAVNFVVAWVWVRETIGHDPTMYEYAEYWGTSQATAYREQEAFREVSGFDSPAEVAAAAEAAGLKLPGRRDSKPDPVEGLALIPFLAGS